MFTSKASPLRLGRAVSPRESEEPDSGDIAINSPVTASEPKSRPFGKGDNSGSGGSGRGGKPGCVIGSRI